MDLSLSAKPQTLTLISCLSPSSSSSTFSSHRFCSLHREFLGCGNRLRPPGLRSRKRWRKSGFQVQSPRFVVRGSMFSQPIVVFVAVAAISALTVVYFNFTRRNSDGDEDTGPDAENANSNDVSEKVKVVLKHAAEIQTLNLRDTIVDTHTKSVSEEVKVVLKQDSEIQSLNLGDTTIDTHIVHSNFTSENGNASETQEKELNEESYSSNVGNFTSEIVNASETRERELNEESYSSNVAVLTSSNGDLGSTMVLEGMLELRIESPGGAELGSDAHVPEDAELGAKSLDPDDPQLGSDPHGSDVAQLVSESNGFVVESVSNGSITHVNSENQETKEDHKLNHAVSQAIESQIPSHSSSFTEYSRKELYTFYEQNQDRTKCVSNFRNPRSIATRVQRGNSLPSVPRANAATSEISIETFPQYSVSVSPNGHLPLPHYKDGSSTSNGKYRRGGELPVDIENVAPQNRQSGPESLQTNGKRVDAKHDSQNYLSTYNRLVRDGRLADCIELLESTEQKGLLDMDKIYHAKFFNICKSQKAVKQAFRFAKLIGNPTLSTFNMLLSVCASSQDSEGAFQVLHLVKEAGLRADCKLYTTLISTCAKSGKVDTMFKVFHEMVNAGVEPNLHTYGALIDGCARAGQVAKAFGAYGILRSKNVKPDRVVFNALITACGQSGAVDRAFDVLAEMKAEPTPVDPDHVTVGALLRTCTLAGQVDRAREVYKMLHKYKIRGTPEVYTIAVSSCSQTGDLEFALSVYRDMTRNGITPDEMFLSAIMDVAGHAGKVDVAFEILKEAKARRIKLGTITYGSLMGACCNSKNWQKALELHEDIRSIKLPPTVSMLNALVTALCDGDQLQKAVEVLAEMKETGVSPNIITYSILLVRSEKKDDLEIGHMLYSQAKKEGITPNLIMCKCLIGMCLRRFEKAYSLGEPVLSFKSGKPEIDNEWTSMALTVHRESIISGLMPTMEVFSLVLGCLQFPHDATLRVKLVENLGVSADASKCSNLNSLIDGFGEYDPRAFSLLEEASSHGIVPSVNFKHNTIVVDTRKMEIHIAEVYLLTILKGLKHRLAAGARLANINIVLPTEKTQVLTSKQEKTIKLAGRVGQAVGALLRRLGLHYQGSGSNGKIRINGISVKRWLQPKLAASPFSGNPSELNSTDMRLGKGIAGQQRDIRMSDMSIQ